MDITDLRITKLKDYLTEFINEISNKIKINVDALDKNIDSYSLDKIPTQSVVTKWVNGTEIHKDVYSFRSRKNYSYNELNNLSNIGFFETFEKLIKDNNREGILPDIEGIQSIECLNCGTLQSANTGTAIFEIQIQITYKIN